MSGFVADSQGHTTSGPTITWREYEGLLARIRELKAQAERYKTSLLDLAIEIGQCRCGPEYTGRGLIAPNCAWHQSSTPEILEEAGLLGEYQARIDAALAAREGCDVCHQADIGQTWEYPCPACGLPRVWDAGGEGK